jgi:enoyl-CoA hydratase/carnithine racemase
MLRTERKDGYAVVVLDAPERLNAIGSETLAELNKTLDGLVADAGVRCLVVTGEGRAFSAGANIAEFAGFDTPVQFQDFLHDMTDTYARLERLRMPVIAAVNGFAFGGGLELVLSCDIRIAARSAWLGLPEIKLGILPGAGGTQRIIRQLPRAVAMHMMMTGEPVSSDEALHHGLVNRVVDDGAALAAAEELAASLATMPPLALAAAKRLVTLGASLDLDAAITFERETVGVLFGTNDGREGRQAFLEKRGASFTGR